MVFGSRRTEPNIGSMAAPLILNFGVWRRFQDVIYAVRRLNGSPEKWENTGLFWIGKQPVEPSKMRLGSI